MFSFLKFLNSKSDDEKSKGPNSLSGKTLNLNSPEARALNVFNNKSPIARKSNDTLRSDCKETVTSPGFSFRIAQKAREMRSTTPNTDVSNLSTSYTLDLNGSNLINGSNASRDIYDKKRKLMETLDNFGVRKRTRQEVIYKNGVDAFVNRRRRTISESNAPDRVIVMNGHNHRFNQPIPTVTNSSAANVENKKTKRQGDFGTNMCHPQKKPRTRNNEILSSYSSSKFLLTPGQKRPYPSDHEEESPDRKHCKSCTCCGSTVLLHNDLNISNKSDKTTETDLSNDLVTVAASRIFNRSGKTQIIKKICMKTILDEVFEDIDPVPYTSIDKLEEKKKKAQKKVISIEQYNEKSNVTNGNQCVDSAAPLPIISTYNETQPAVTNIMSTVTSTSSSTTLITTSTVQSTMPLKIDLQSSENTSKISELNKSNTSLPFSFGSPIASTVTSVKENLKQANAVDEKVIDKKTPESTKNNIEQNKFILSPETNKNIVNSQNEGQNNFNNDKDKPSFQLTVPVSKPNESVKATEKSLDNSKKDAAPSLVFGSQVDNSLKQDQPSFTFGVPKADKQLTPVMQFGVSKANKKQSTPILQPEVPKSDEKQSTPVMQFGVPKSNEKQSTPVMQFGVLKSDDKQSTTPIMQFGVPKVVDKQSTAVLQFDSSKVDKQLSPVLQFGAPKVVDKQSTPIMQFGATKDNDKQTTSIVQFGISKSNDKHSTPALQFGATKTDIHQSTPKLQFEVTKGSENPTSTPSLFSFGNNQKSIENSKPTDSVKFQFCPSKPDNASLTESTNVVVFGSNSQTKNLFNFGNTDNITSSTDNPPKYDTTTEKSTPKLQFGALPTPAFGVSTADQSKSQFSIPVSQSAINQSPKLVFGSQTTDNKSTTSGMVFANNTANPIFQFNNSGSKPGDKPSETQSSSFPFSSNKTTSAFGTSDKPAFQFNTQKTEETKTQFSTSAFGSQNTSAPFKFGGNEKPASFGTTFPSSNQPLQFTNNTEKAVEPFKFGSTVPTSNAFQFSANKTDNGPVKFGQASNTFATSGFNGFGNSAPQQTNTFGAVQSPQPSPFGNITSPNAAPTFGSVATSPSNTFGSVATSPSNTFGTNPSFQFGSTNNAPSSSSTFAFGSNSQPTKPDGAFSFNSASTTGSPFQFGQAPSTPQFGGTQPNQGSFGFGSPPMSATVMPGSSQPLFSMGTAPAGERRKAKAVRRRQ
ncbi:nucleoporin NUP1 isoform X2 [Rhopalosiphum maidis]|uniref:nucleoporin NUP1 isoform X2 n=1 Tax=Rhopalosiphum maidis TaxID=43146 RepID=UPI000EFEC54F|nr:nucleoporin NUP1 isoform X2 [Rhopalosiphum maidis]